jgi:tetratricopeptide (TPR) repeat protein
MKKLVLMAMMLVASATTFAGDSDALKAIMKTKTFAEAEQLVNSTVDQLANAQEKAKAYNHVTKLAYETFKHQVDIPQLNATNGTKEEVDEALKAEAAYTALKNSIECEKYDPQPNEKGKVKIQFREKNQSYIPEVRQEILIASQREFNANNYEKALKYAGFFITCIDEELFKTFKPGAYNIQQNMDIAAYYAFVSAYNQKDMELTGKFARIAMNSENAQIADFAFRYLMESMKGTLATPADTARYENNLIALLKEMPEKESVYASLTELYINKENYDKALKLTEERIAAYPDSVLPYAYKGSILMGQDKYDESIEAFSKISENNKNYLMAQFNIGICYWQKASKLNEELTDKKTGNISVQNAKKVQDMIRNAVEPLENVRKHDPEHEKIHQWPYRLYQVYYALKDTAKMAELEAIDPSLKSE